MRPSGEGFFRGSELPRLLILAAVALGGLFAVIAAQNRQAAQPEPPAAPRPTAAEPLPPADAAIELQGLIDKTPMSVRDNPAYLLLLDRVRRNPPAQLDRHGRRDIVFSQLIDNPARYRGLPIHIEGTILRVLRQETSDSKLFPKGFFYEAHIITPDSQNFPYILAFEDAPPHLPVGDDVRVHATFVGYFFKLFAYVSGDGRRFAPLLVGRLRWVEPPRTKRAQAAGAGGGAGLQLSWPWIALLGLLLYMIVRWGLFLRRAFAPVRRPPQRSTIVTDRIDPESLADWLNSPSDDPDDGPAPGRSQPGPSWRG